MSLIISIVGKENVGKSTLFNKLCCKKIATSDHTPGVTIDSKSYRTEFNGLFLELIDTAGWNDKKSNLSSKIVSNTINTSKESDIILFLVDGKNGLTKSDIELADIVRKLNKNVILIVNKCESTPKVEISELYKLGLGEAIHISAEHKLGFDLLYNLFSKYRKAKEKFHSDDNQENTLVSIVGKPNVGKSTLFNTILGFDRVIESEISGTTRDCITYDLLLENKKLSLIDTAGLKKKGKINNHLEEMFFSQSVTAIRRSNAVILVVDALNLLEKQDLSIAQIAINEGKILVLVVNKCDLITDLDNLKKELKLDIKHKLSQLSDITIFYISAISKPNYTNIFKTIFNLKASWENRIPTSKLNKWLGKAITENTPPMMSNNKRLKIKYVKQSASKPPTFTFFTNVPKKDKIPENYKKYLLNHLKDSFFLSGVIIRFDFKKSDNPYD